MNLATIRELFAYNDWARDRLMTCVAPLDDAKLDRVFEMGEGSLRKTLEHIHGSEWAWLQRWKGWSPTKADLPGGFPSMTAVWERWRQTATERGAYLATLKDADLASPITYSNYKGESHSARLGYMMLHVCNHGTHHRAQAINMLRHVGIAAPGLDLIIMHLDR